MLTELAIKRAKPRERAYKLGDSGWMYLLVTPSGGKLWRQNYRFGGKIKTLALGKYPEISLAEARALAAANRVKLAHGEDPAPSRRDRGTTIGTLAQEWLDNHTPKWHGNTERTARHQIKNHLLPALGARHPDDISPQELETVITAIAAKSPITAKRILSIVGDLFDIAIRRGITQQNPARALRGVVSKPPTVHRAALTTPEELGAFLRALEAYNNGFVPKMALRFLALVFARPGNVREAEWSEINRETATWTIPAAKTKTSEDYIVPLSRQALAILDEMEPFSGHRKYIFSGEKGNAIVKNSIQYTIRSMGYKDILTAHGFRATARTLLHEVLHYPPDAIEAQLGHSVPDRLGRAYNRARHLDIRREMMQAWADYLDTLRQKASENA